MWLPDTLKRLWKRESGDLGLLALCCALIPLVWGTVFGWRPNLYIMGADGWAMMVPYLRDLLAHGGDWTQLIYRPEVQGGVALHDTAGTLLLHQICGWLGFSVTTTANLTVFIAQGGLAFIGVRFAEELAQRWRLQSSNGEGFVPESPWWERVFLNACMVILFAFAPIFSWRIFYGHVIMLFGTSVFFGFFALFLAALNARLSISFCGVVLFAMLQVFPTCMQQSIVYGFVFGAPVLIAFCASEFWRERQWGFVRSLRVPLLILVSALLLSMPKLAGLLNYAFGSDAARSVASGNDVVFSYLTLGWRDLVSSLLWGMEGRGSFFGVTSPELLHELNLPLGPLLLVVFSLAVRRSQNSSRGVALGLIISLLLACGFASNLHPISDIVLAVMPLLKSFRVPSRALLPVAILVPVLASAHFLGFISQMRIQKDSRMGRVLTLLAVGSVLIAFAPALLREFLAWAMTMGLIAISFRGAKSSALRSVFVGLFALLSVTSLFSFKERSGSLLDLGEAQSDFADIRAEILVQDPTLNMPLVRTALSDDVAGFNSNSSWMLGLASPNGYFFPLRRYLELVSELDGLPLDPTVVNFRFKAASPAFEVIKKLYDLHWRIHFDQSGKAQMERIESALGAAWFASGIQLVPTMRELATVLKKRIAIGGGARALVNASDTIVKRMRVSEFERLECKNSQVIGMAASHGVQSVVLEVKNEEPLCPLVVSMNYMEGLRAYVLLENDFREREINLFPIEGALTGVLVPKIANHPTFKILIIAVPHIPFWARLAFFVGLLLLLLFGGNSLYKLTKPAREAQ